ncbi:MAG TPA: FAD-dependent oxidoreductase [Conexibacter sp.]|nr:FAD-dependent oxidoreductase [Conexibacter sp.]
MTRAEASGGKHVVIAGGGIAAVETLLALRSLASTRIDVTLVAPHDDLHYRPATVSEPFSEPRARRYRLDAICRDLGATLHVDTAAAVDPAGRELVTGSAARLPYDALVIAVGARARRPLAHAHTFLADEHAESLHGLVRDLEEGYVGRLALVVPAKAGWSLPIYELALKAAQRARSLGSEGLELTIVTPEDVPLAAFRGAGSDAVARLLDEAGITVLCSTYVSDFDGRTLALAPGSRSLAVDAVLALPELSGPRLAGVPCDSDGFVHVDERGRVPGLDGVYAIGDATTFPIKQGGIAAQQADVAAASVAQALGLDVRQPRTRPVRRAILLTGAEPLYVTATIAGGESVASHASRQCMWWPPHKVAARHLAPYLADREEIHPATARRDALDLRLEQDPPVAHAEGEAAGIEG